MKYETSSVASCVSYAAAGHTQQHFATRSGLWQLLSLRDAAAPRCRGQGHLTARRRKGSQDEIYTTQSPGPRKTHPSINQQQLADCQLVGD